MTVKDVMSPHAVTLSDTATFGEAAQLLAKTFVSDLHVLDGEGNFVGVVPEGDLIRYTLPNMDDLALSKGLTMQEANRRFLSSGKINVDSNIKPLIIYDAITLDPDDALIKPAMIFISKNIRSLPVVSNSKLLGVVSRTSIIMGMIQNGPNT